MIIGCVVSDGQGIGVENPYGLVLAVHLYLVFASDDHNNSSLFQSVVSCVAIISELLIIGIQPTGRNESLSLSQLTGQLVLTADTLCFLF